MAPTFPYTRLQPIDVFATEDTVAQIVWRDLPAGELSVIVDGTETVLGDAGQVGAAEVTGLRPATDHPVDIAVNGRVIAQKSIRTEPKLAGKRIARVATISDLHLGEEGFGLFKKMRERPQPDEFHPLRCAKAAVREAIAWGAELLVIKGDITDRSELHEWEQFDDLLATTDIPVVALPGNHDTCGKKRAVDATEQLQARGLFHAPVQVRDLGGVRVIAVDSTVPTHSWGRVKHRGDDLVAAADVMTPALVFMHHHLESSVLPWFWPLGTHRFDGRPTIDWMLGTNPDLLFSSGHTHRNRIRRHGSGLVTEVGSTKDHPGVWAGYDITTLGVRQTVRRVADPSCIAWTDRTHAVVGGVWGQWSPGGTNDRVVTHHWVRASQPAPQQDAVATIAG